MNKIIKKLSVSLVLLSFPLSVLAYSNKVILGGQNIGITINSKGVLVVGFYKVNNVYNPSHLLAGDYIIKVGVEEVNSIKELVQKVDKLAKDNKVDITFIRDDKEYTTTLNLENNNGSYKTGVYVKDSMLGNGTLTYIDPETKIYGALGHYIIDSSSNEAFAIKDGKIFKSIITSITKSSNGNPGSINTKFFKDTIYGDINKNSEAGIFGKFTSDIDNDNLIEIAEASEIKTGPALIVTSLANNEKKEYEINILRVEKNNKIKNIYFEITDEDLIKQAGGVVQGMSGSPIIQNNKLIGAVTHVTIDNVKYGYGISIINMLEEGEK